jgi:hypothetical protein
MSLFDFYIMVDWSGGEPCGRSSSSTDARLCRGVCFERPTSEQEGGDRIYETNPIFIANILERAGRRTG